MITLTGEDGPDALKDDIEAIGRVSAVGSMLKAICERTSMGYAAVAPGRRSSAMRRRAGFEDIVIRAELCEDFGSDVLFA